MKPILSLCFSIMVFSAGAPCLAAPPKVVQATPDNGAKAVNPNLKMLRIVFDQPMALDRYSIAGGGPNFPKLVGKAGWVDHHTFVAPWQLEPEHDYWLSVNSSRFTDFRNAQGEPAAPYVIAFRTRKASAIPMTTPNEFLKRGQPTFVLGTAGDERANHALETQVEMLRSMLFASAPTVKDQTIDVAKGTGAWPRNAVVFGGSHMNSVLKRLAPSLPFSMQRGRLQLGDQVFEGDEYRLIAVIPARQADAKGPGYPEFLLYAGAGSPGVAEINAVEHGADPILVADAFGRLLSGEWEDGIGGQPKPCFAAPRARRIAWRAVQRQFSSPSRAGAIQIHFAEQLPRTANEGQMVEACVRGLSQAARRLELSNPAPVSIYIYPDRGSIRALTGNAGDGHADIISHSVHVIAYDSAVGGGLERLLAHEGTHVLAYEAWGAAGTPLLGEGLAVWASGSYGGEPLEAWKSRLRGQVPVLAHFLGKGFRQTPEQQAYPLAGLFVEAAVRKVGLAKFRACLVGATAATFDKACRDAGTTPSELEGAWRASLSL